MKLVSGHKGSILSEAFCKIGTLMNLQEMLQFLLDFGKVVHKIHLILFN